MKLILAMLAGAQAHNWLALPGSYNGNAASQAKPCPEKKAEYVATEAKSDTDIPFTWTDNHSGTHWVKVVNRADVADLEAIQPGDPKMVFYRDYGAGSTTGPVKIETPGSYVAQYGWSGYRNCVDLDISGEALAPLESSNGVCSPTVGSNGYDQCALTQGINSACDTATNQCKCNTGYFLDANNVCRDSSDTTPATCANYCSDVMATCTGASAVYSSKLACFASCATFAQGTKDNAQEDSLECRFYHIHVEGGTPEHCSHAGPSGGGKCVSPAGTLAKRNAAAVVVYGTPGLTTSGLEALFTSELTSQGAAGVQVDVFAGEGMDEYIVNLNFGSAGDVAEFTSGSGASFAAMKGVENNAQVVGIDVAEQDPPETAAASTSAAVFATVMALAMAAL
jgi:hypothetical protein